MSDKTKDKTYVYQLVARFADPFCPGPVHLAALDRNKVEMHSTTVFTTPDRALARADAMRSMVRRRLKVTDDYVIDVVTRSYEVVD